MAAEEEGGRTRRKGRAGRTAVEEAGQGGRDPLVGVDPWGAFLEDFWERPAEAESNLGGRGGERNTGKGTRRTGTKPGR